MRQIGRLPIAIASICLAGGAVFAAGPATAASSFKSSFDRAVNQFNRDACRTFNSLSCQRKAPGKAKQKPPAPSQADKPAKAEQELPPPPPPSPIPKPRKKPRIAKAKAKAEEKAVPVAEALTPPIPRPKPVLPRHAQSSPKTKKPERTASAGQAHVEVPVPKTRPDAAARPSSAAGGNCRKQLGALGMKFSTPVTAVSAGQCDIAEPVQLVSWKSGDDTLVFPESPLLDCGFALRLGQWLKEEAVPTARKNANAGIAKLSTGPGYQCRGRNGDANAKISEHGFGNAIDIASFTMTDGQTFMVKDAKDPMSPGYQTLAGFRSSACKYFTTVLGPGANAAHEEHFHFDLGKHGSSGTYRICE